MRRKLTSKIGKEQAAQRKSRFVDDMAVNSARLSAPVGTEQVTPGRVLVVSQRLLVPITPDFITNCIAFVGTGFAFRMADPIAVSALSVPNNAGRFFFDAAAVRCRLGRHR
jgi:hypothetical protein